jgi:hypothetical protein
VSKWVVLARLRLGSRWTLEARRRGAPLQVRGGGSVRRRGGLIRRRGLRIFFRSSFGVYASQKGVPSLDQPLPPMASSVARHETGLRPGGSRGSGRDLPSRDPGSNVGSSRRSGGRGSRGAYSPPHRGGFQGVVAAGRRISACSFAPPRSPPREGCLVPAPAAGEGFVRSRIRRRERFDHAAGTPGNGAETRARLHFDESSALADDPCTVDSPRAGALSGSLVVKNGSKISRRTASSIPQPVSSADSTA